MMNRRNMIYGAAAVPLFSRLSVGQDAAKHPGTYGFDTPGAEFLTSLDRLLELSGVPGFSAAVTRDGRTLWSHNVGFADLQSHRSISSSSLLPAASLGKPLFALGVLLLADQGALDLDRPLRSYVSVDQPSGNLAEQVTARHVLTHTTGFPNWRDEQGEPLTSRFKPGSQFHYSGEGFYLLQRCVEQITGTGCEAWMQQRVLMPLGMKSSTFLWNRDAADSLVQGYQGGVQVSYSDFAPLLFADIQKSTKSLSTWNHDTITATMMGKMKSPRPPMPRDMIPNVASSLLTTAADYSAFLSECVSPRIPALALQPATRAKIGVQVHPINSALGWGLGWGVEHLGSADYLWQWGDNGGWKNFAIAHPPTKSTLCIFTNGSNGMHLAERLIKSSSGRDHAQFLWL